MIGAAIGGSLLQASSASKAAKSQQQAAASQLALQERMYEEQRDLLSPYVQGGQEYSNALRYELMGGDRPMMGGTAPNVTEFTDTVPGPYDPNFGHINQGRNYDYQPGRSPDRQVTKYRVGDQVFGDRDAAQAYATANPTGGTEYQGFEATPYQRFVMDETQQALDASAASRGNLFSGATMKAQMDRRNALAGGFYGEYLDRLTGQAASGQNAAAMQGGFAGQYAQGGSNALANMGNAGAAGAIGVGNALSGGINNAMNIWGWQQAGSGGLTPGYRPPSNMLMSQVQRAVG
jgi:hypothetical protein